MSEVRHIGSHKPFVSTAKEYREKGWDVVPLPERQKANPPIGFTGRKYKGRFATEQEIEQWFEEYPKGNIAVHPGNPIEISEQKYEAIGIDVDDYDGKHGYSRLIELEDVLGELPATYISSARTDCRSGHRWYLVPYGFEYKGKVTENIEVIQHVHRYGVSFPSWHPDTQEQYFWYAPGQLPNGRSFCEIPYAKNLALLPEKWFKYLRKGTLSLTVEAIDENITRAALYHWAKEHFVDGQNMCRKLKRTFNKHMKDIKESTDHHGPLTNAHWSLLHLGAEGHSGWANACQQIDKAWLERIIEEGRDSKRNLYVAQSEMACSSEDTLRKIKGKIDSGLLGLVSEDPCIAKARGTKDPTTDALAQGQVRMARNLCNHYEGKVIFVPHVNWHYWDGMRWKEDVLNKITQRVIYICRRAQELSLAKSKESQQFPDGSAQREKLEAFAKRLWADATKCQSSSGIEGVVKLARSNAKVASPMESLNIDPYLLNLQNCTLNLKTGECKQHDPSDFITKVCNASFDPAVFQDFCTNPEKYCPKWLKFLSEVIPNEEVREFLATLAGISLAGTQLEHILVILHGIGRNGKGTYEEILRYVWGDYGVLAASDLFTAKPGAHTTSQTDLMGSRLAIVDETEQQSKLSEALVKNMTGGGVHVARRMAKDNIRFPKTWLAMMVTNHLPVVTGTDAAIWDRLVVVEFPVYFDKQHRDKNLREALKKEADGIFMWAYKSWLAYQDSEYKLVYPAAVEESNVEYRHSHDKMQLWLDERCEVGNSLYRSSPSELNVDFNNFMLKEGGQGLGKKQFLQAMREKNFRCDARKGRIYGIRLKLNNIESNVKGGAPQ